VPQQGARDACCDSRDVDGPTLLVVIVLIRLARLALAAASVAPRALHLAAIPFDNIDESGLDDFDVPLFEVCERGEFQMPTIGACYARDPREILRCGCLACPARTLLAHIAQMDVDAPIVFHKGFVSVLVGFYPVAYLCPERKVIVWRAV
jgi:hypothetical protein